MNQLVSTGKNKTFKKNHNKRSVKKENFKQGKIEEQMEKEDYHNGSGYVSIRTNLESKGMPSGND